MRAVYSNIIKGLIYHLIRALSSKYNTDRLNQHDDIQPGGPVGDVEVIHADPFVVAGVATAVGLPVAGHAGPDLFVDGVDVAVLGDFALHDGSGADKAHGSQEHVGELREFVEAGLAQERADAGDAGVILEFVCGFEFGFQGGVAVEHAVQFGFGVAVHAAEFEAVEGFAISAQAAGAVHGRSGAVELDGQGDQ